MVERVFSTPRRFTHPRAQTNLGPLLGSDRPASFAQEDAVKFALHNTSFLPTTGDPRDMWPELRDRVQWMEANGFD